MKATVWLGEDITLQICSLIVPCCCFLLDLFDLGGYLRKCNFTFVSLSVDAVAVLSSAMSLAGL